MHDEPKSWMADPQIGSSVRALRRVADTLGVPVSSFGSVDADARPGDVPAGPEEAAVLATIQSYLERANPMARERFVAAVQTIIETSTR